MNSKSVISIVLNNFTNDSRVLKEGLSLQAAGYSVTVVALHENDLAEYEQIQALSVHRVKVKSRGWIKWKPVQLLKYLEFVIRVIFRYRNQVGYVHCNDLNALPIGYLLKKLSKREVKVIYDCHEYETERDGMSSGVKKILKFFERRLIMYADAVITVSDAIANCYSQDYGIRKPSLVLNCPNYQSIGDNDIFRNELGIPQDKKVFLYQGGLKSGRGIELLVEAFKQSRREDCVIVFMGFGPLEQFIQEQQCSAIFFYPAVSPSILLNYTASADYGVSFIEDTCLSYRYCLPNKMFEYLMAGLPVLTSNLREMKQLVETHNLGVVADDNTVEGFVNALSASLEMDYQQVRSNVEKVKKEFCWEEQEKVLLDVYKSF